MPLGLREELLKKKRMASMNINPLLDPRVFKKKKMRRELINGNLQNPGHNGLISKGSSLISHIISIQISRWI